MERFSIPDQWFLVSWVIDHLLGPKIASWVQRSPISKPVNFVYSFEASQDGESAKPTRLRPDVLLHFLSEDIWAQAKRNARGVRLLVVSDWSPICRVRNP
jgi:hypothetical protein